MLVWGLAVSVCSRHGCKGIHIYTYIQKILTVVKGKERPKLGVFDDYGAFPAVRTTRPFSCKLN